VSFGEEEFLGFRFQDLGFGVKQLGCRVQGLGVRRSVLGVMVHLAIAQSTHRPETRPNKYPEPCIVDNPSPCSGVGLKPNPEPCNLPNPQPLF
jgi:hypothetical protein